MKQAKLRAAGEHVDRQDVVEVIIEESVQAAQHGVMERFSEIAKERGFDESTVGERQSNMNYCLEMLDRCIRRSIFGVGTAHLFPPITLGKLKAAQCPVTAVN